MNCAIICCPEDIAGRESRSLDPCKRDLKTAALSAVSFNYSASLPAEVRQTQITAEPFDSSWARGKIRQHQMSHIEAVCSIADTIRDGNPSMVNP